MELIIKIKDRKITLVLKERKKILDETSFLEERNLSNRLLLEIDKLLKRNNLNPQNVPLIRVDCDLSDSYTTARIAKSVANTWNEFGKAK